MAAKPKAVVNLDALIQRADLAAPGEAAEDIADISILDLDPKGFLYPALRKPDFQRETAGWTPEQVADPERFCDRRGTSFERANRMGP
jgi:hypothetical protein